MATTVKTIKAVSEHFGVSRRMVTKWLRREDPMPGKRGAYDLEAIAEWRKRTFLKGKDQQQVVDPENLTPEQWEEADKGYHGSQNAQLLQAKVRKEKALAFQNELKAKKMDTGFVELKAVEEWVVEFLQLQRKLLQAIPIDMFAAVPDEHRRIYQPDLEARLEIHLNQMGDWVERTEDIAKE